MGGCTQHSEDHAITPPPRISRESRADAGFTLIELSIVLVIIGLIVGSVLVGRDLISAAAIRGQISQIEGYQQAVNTFKGKYGHLPGDIRDPDATNFGFATRGTNQGQGDGNGLLQGNGAYFARGVEQTGENLMFWVDLARVNLIASGISTATPTTTALPLVPNTDMNKYFPPAKLLGYINTFSFAGVNYFQLSNGVIISTAHYIGGALTPPQARNIDAKIDDGKAEYGNVSVLRSVNTGNPSMIAMWGYTKSSTGACWLDDVSPSPCTTALAVDATSCIDNGNTAGVVPDYSVALVGGSTNCTLSFKMQ